MYLSEATETVVLPASHVQISGPVLNFLRLLLAGGAAAARRRASGTYLVVAHVK